MSELNIKINLDNAAFEGMGRDEEIRSILTAIANRIELNQSEKGSCIDSNGNTVGEWSISEMEYQIDGSVINRTEEMVEEEETTKLLTESDINKLIKNISFPFLHPIGWESTEGKIYFTLFNSVNTENNSYPFRVEIDRKYEVTGEVKQLGNNYEDNRDFVFEINLYWQNAAIMEQMNDSGVSDQIEETIRYELEEILKAK